jgi:hypothetical protein
LRWVKPRSQHSFSWLACFQFAGSWTREGADNAIFLCLPFLPRVSLALFFSVPLFIFYTDSRSTCARCRVGRRGWRGRVGKRGRELIFSPATQKGVECRKAVGHECVGRRCDTRQQPPRRAGATLLLQGGVRRCEVGWAVALIVSVGQLGI